MDPDKGNLSAWHGQLLNQIRTSYIQYEPDVLKVRIPDEIGSDSPRLD